MSKSIYLDANGGMPMCASAVEKYRLASELTNPANTVASSGRISSDIYNQSAKMIKRMVGSPQDKIIAMGSATEANASILYSIHKNYPCGHVVLTEDNHPSVEEALKSYGIRYDKVAPSITAIKGAINHLTICFMFPLVASLTGKIYPIRSWVMQIKRLDEKYVCICDATQGVGRIPVNRVNLLCDYMTFSSHKFAGPKGIGFVLMSHAVSVREDLKWYPLVPGSQQDGMRGGTDNVPGVVASAEALHVKIQTLYEDRKSALAQTKQLYREISTIEQAKIINVASEDELDKTLGNTLLIQIGTCPKRVAHMLSLHGYDMGTGCACQTDKPSDTLRISIPFGQAEPLDELPKLLASILHGEKIPEDPAGPASSGSDDIGTLTPGTPITEEQAIWCAKQLHIDIDAIPGKLVYWMIGLKIEREHGPPPEGLDTTNIAQVDLLTVGKIALAHILEIPDYYTRLEKLEKEGEKFWEGKEKPKIVKDAIA